MTCESYSPCLPECHGCFQIHRAYIDGRQKLISGQWRMVLQRNCSRHLISTWKNAVRRLIYRPCHCIFCTVCFYRLIQRSNFAAATPSILKTKNLPLAETSQKCRTFFSVVENFPTFLKKSLYLNKKCVHTFINFHTPCKSNVVLIHSILCRESGSACVHKSSVFLNYLF